MHIIYRLLCSLSLSNKFSIYLELQVVCGINVLYRVEVINVFRMCVSIKLNLYFYSGVDIWMIRLLFETYKVL